MTRKTETKTETETPAETVEVAETKERAPIVPSSDPPAKVGPGTPLSDGTVPVPVPQADPAFVHVYPTETGYEMNIRLQEEAKVLVPRPEGATRQAVEEDRPEVEGLEVK